MDIYIIYSVSSDTWLNLYNHRETNKEYKETLKNSVVQDVHMGLRLFPFYGYYALSFNLQVKYQTKSLFCRK